MPRKTETVLIALHDNQGHLGPERTFNLLDNLYWPGMQAEVKSYCHSCIQCIKRVYPIELPQWASLESRTHGTELVCIYFVSGAQL